MINGRNELAKPEKEDILDKLEHEQVVDEGFLPFGNGNSAEKIVDEMEIYFKR